MTTQTVSELTPGQVITIYGDVPVTVTSVTPSVYGDFVKLCYRRDYAEGRVYGMWSLPAGTLLPLVDGPTPQTAR